MNLADVEAVAIKGKEECRASVTLATDTVLELVEIVRFLALERDRLAKANGQGT